MGDFLVFSKALLVASVMMLSMSFNGKNDFSSHTKGPSFKIESTMERTPVFDDFSIYRKQIEVKVNVIFSDKETFRINDNIIVRLCDFAADNTPIINDKNGYTSYMVDSKISKAGFSVILYPKLAEKMNKPKLYVTIIRDGNIVAYSSPEVSFNAKQKQYNIIVKRVK